MDIEFKRPQIEDKELMEKYFRTYPYKSCDRTFMNVYLWARFYNAGYAVIEDTLVVINEDDGKASFSYPSGKPENIRKAIEALTFYCKDRGVPFVLHGVVPEMFAELETMFPGRFQISYQRDYADYVYETEKLATLAGKKLHSKRNHINRFMSDNSDWSYEPLTQENREECFQMALQWRIQNGCADDPEKNCEMCVSLNALRMFRELGAVGGILRVDGKIVAFTIGEPVTDDTFVVHIEKAFAEVDGAYPMINQQFVRHECMNYQYVNREDDAGSEGLRKAKLSYKPAILVEKGIVTEVTADC